jgi:hypothetical protein
LFINIRDEEINVLMTLIPGQQHQLRANPEQRGMLERPRKRQLQQTHRRRRSRQPGDNPIKLFFFASDAIKLECLTLASLCSLAWWQKYDSPYKTIERHTDLLGLS